MLAIREQIRVSEEYADGLLNRDHRLAMACCDIEDFIILLMGLAGVMQQCLDGFYRNPIIDEAKELEWNAAYRELLAVFDKLAQLIDQFKALSFTVAQAAEFEVAHHRLIGIATCDFRELREASEGIRLGRGRPWREVVRELRDTAGAKSGRSTEQEVFEFKHPSSRD